MIIILDKSLDFIPNVKMLNPGLTRGLGCLSPREVADSTVTLSQLRATYRFDYSWDLVTEARWIGQPSADFNEFGFVVEAGYYLTPELRLSAGYVFGKVDDSDFSGTRSAGGPYIGATFKLSDVFDSFGQPKAPVKK